MSESTLYVNLEPCVHHGKTPPCSQLIINKNLRKVVIGIKDPNEKVAGKGIKMLKNAGIDVRIGILQDACTTLNKRFLVDQHKKRPYIILKWAQTLDGFIDIIRKNDIAQPTWITEDLSLRLTHRFRSIEDAIFIGTNTAIKDNPSLTVRNWSGRNPVRIVIDKRLQLSKSYNVLNKDARTLIINNIKNHKEQNLEFIRFNFEEKSLTDLLTIFHEKGIQSIIIEGGTKTIQSFIDNNLWDEAQVSTGRKMFFTGVKAPTLKNVVLKDKVKLNNDEFFIFHNASVN